jgi:hypothetical protein
MIKKTHTLLFAILLLNVINIGTIFATFKDDSQIRKEVFEEVNSILLFDQANNSTGIRKLIDELESKWFQKDKEQYIFFMYRTTETFNSEGKHDLADKYSKIALDKLYNLPESEKFPVSSEVLLISEINQGILNNSENLYKKENWPVLRCEAAKYYIRVLERIEKNINPNWNPTSNPNPPPRPPANYTGPFFSGMSPDNIKDPNIRAEYQAAINKFRAVSKYNSEQYELRRIKETGLLQRQIIRFYSGPEFLSKNLETEALNSDIAKYVKDERIITSMLDDLQKKLADDLKPKQHGPSMTGYFEGYQNPLTHEITEKQLSPPGYLNEVELKNENEDGINKQDKTSFKSTADYEKQKALTEKSLGLALPIGLAVVAVIVLSGVIMLLRKKKLKKAE